MKTGSQLKYLLQVPVILYFNV